MNQKYPSMKSMLSATLILKKQARSISNGIAFGNLEAPVVLNLVQLLFSKSPYLLVIAKGTALDYSIQMIRLGNIMTSRMIS